MKRVAALGLISLGAVSAAAQDVTGGYIGGELGLFSYDEDLTIIAPGAAFDESDLSLKVYGGYRFNDYVGVEADFRTIDDLESTQSIFLPDIGTVNIGFGAQFDALTIRAIGYLPLSWGSLIYGGGYFDYDADVVARVSIDGSSLPGPPPEPIPDFEVRDSASDTGGTAILGLQWELEKVDLRLSYEWFNFEDADVQQIGVGVAYRFR